MDFEEVKKKDWQLLTAYSEMTNTSYLMSILENQAVIISELKKLPLSDVTKTMTKYRDENYKKVLKLVKNNIPDYPTEERSYE